MRLFYLSCTLTCTTVWKYLHRQSKLNPPEFQSGYSLLLPVSGDLPVFLKIALEICNAQISEGLIETLVLPDRPSRQLASLLHIWAKRYWVSPLRLVNPHPLEPVLAGMHSIPLIDLQLKRGVQATQTQYALVQPMGEFVVSPDAMRSQYLAALKFDNASPTAEPRNGDGIAHPDRGSALDVRELSRMPASKLWAAIAAAQTHEDSISLHQVVKFPGLLPAYRRYQQSRGSFEDSEFHLLLMRLLVDAYDQSGRSYQLPLIDDLTRGVTDPAARITYTHPSTRLRYANFRQGLHRILQSGLLDPMKADIMQDELSLFERNFL